MKKLVSSAVALLAGTVAVSTLVQSASAATITYTQNIANFTASNPPPATFNPTPNASALTGVTGCSGTCSQSLTAATSVSNVDRDAYQNADGSYSPGGQSLVYSAIQGYPTSGTSMASYNIGIATTVEILWGSPDTFNTLSFYSGEPGAGGTLLGSLTENTQTPIVANDGNLNAPQGTGHDLVTFSMTGGTFDWLVFTTKQNAFEYAFVTGSVAKTPIPAAWPLFATGLGALGMFGWRRKRKASGTIAAA
jgi:hypothetical protein